MLDRIRRILVEEIGLRRMYRCLVLNLKVSVTPTICDFALFLIVVE